MASEEATQGHLHNLDQVASEPTTSRLDAHCLREAVTYFEAMAAELARLRTALESAQADRQRAVDDLFEQLRVNGSLRAESMRAAVEALRRVATLCDKPIGKFTEADRLEWTDALEALTDEVSPYELRTVAAFLEQQSASQGQPLENIEGLAP